MNNSDITDIEKIYNKKTKENYQEILSDYFNGNYRSAIVVLYPLIISDLLLKLKDLSLIYDDKSASTILKEIESSKNESLKNNKNSKWEKELVERIYKDTELLSIDEYTEIMHIYEHRCLSAHPTLNDDYELISPSKGQILADIQSAYNSVFIKSPLLISNITDKLTDDLAEKKDIFGNDTVQLGSYLRRRYFFHMTDKMLIKTFKSLWKFCFASSGQSCYDENRTVNRRAIEVLLTDHSNLLCDEIKDEKDLFHLVNNIDCIWQLCILLAKFPLIYHCLTDEIKLLIVNNVETDVNLKAFCWFTSSKENNISNLKDYIAKYPGSEIYPNVLEFCNESYIQDGLVEFYIDFCIFYFSLSRNYDSANERYQYAISPNLSFMNKKQFIDLLKVIESNDQIFGRRTHSSSCKEIYKSIQDKYKDEIDFSTFHHFELTEQLQDGSDISI